MCVCLRAATGLLLPFNCVGARRRAEFGRVPIYNVFFTPDIVIWGFFFAGSMLSAILDVHTTCKDG